LVGERLYAHKGEPLEEVVGRLLRNRGAHVSVAESATGGMLGERFTDVPGSSDYFLGGFLTYTDRMKSKLLGVPEELIRQHTAVSEAVAQAMAEGARRNTGAEYALSTTGYAGPDGDQVGVVFIGLASPEGSDVRRMQFVGDRERIRTLACNTALDLLRRRLLKQ
jgi:nicotinamide-nucleotide amidase